MEATTRVRLGEMPDPEMREDDVLVQVHAAGVNLLDSKIRDGEFKLILPYRLPLILGNDVAGVVVRVGSRVRRFKPGDEVYARPDQDRIGTFAEFIAIKEDDVAIKPKNLTMEEAASIPLVGLTAWQALIERANLKKGQKVLIHAGSGGVGTFAIQLAKHSARRWRRRRARPTSTWSEASAPTSSSTTRRRTSKTSCSDYDVVLNSLGQGDAREISASAEAWWKAHLDLRPTGSRLCERHRRVLDLETGHAPVELSDQEESKTPTTVSKGKAQRPGQS